MADRRQITGGEIDGPLAFDNAISPDSVRIKGIVSKVAGRAQILVVPDLEAGNISVRIHAKGPQGAKPRAEVIADILAAIKERRA